MEKNKPQNWMENGKLDEVAFAEEFLQKHQMIACDGAFFSREGRVTDERLLKRAIYLELKNHVRSGVSRKVDSVLATMRLACAHKTLPLEDHVIHLANGTYRFGTGFTPDKDFCRHRLPVNFDKNVEPPEQWLSFLDELLCYEDIQILQEFMGYCLVPTTKAQKMLMIIGQGGEGKSRIGLVMKAIFGDNLSMGSISKLESSPFARADLEHLLVYVDDDMKMEALPSTNVLKTVITSEIPMDLERKGEQSYQGLLTARLMAFGNGALRAVHDHSHGFYRRQIVLWALPRPVDRIDDPELGKKLTAERDQIFMWALLGLLRLRQNHYTFTVSQRSMEAMRRSREEGDPIADFLCSTGYIEFHHQGCATSRQLYETYRDWCADNAMEPARDQVFWRTLRDHAQQLDLVYTNAVPIGKNRYARGFRGIRICQ